MKRNALFAVVSLVAACSDQLPPAPTGGIISGHVRYAGHTHDRFSRPGMVVAAFPDFPPIGPEYGSLTVPRPDFSEPIAYELRNLTPGPVYVLATLVDLDSPRTAPTVLAVGGYPSFCGIMSPSGVVTVGDAPIRDVDVTLYEHSGADDPCTGGGSTPDGCPAPGAATVTATVTGPAGAQPDAAQMLFALFPSWPPFSQPARFKLFSGAEISFPLKVEDAEVPPGRYAAYLCLKPGGFTAQSLCAGDSEPSAVVGDDALIEFAAGTIVTLAFDLAARTASAVKIEDASARGCR